MNCCKKKKKSKNIVSYESCDKLLEKVVVADSFLERVVVEGRVRGDCHVRIGNGQNVTVSRS